MQARRELFTGLGMLIALQVLISLSAVGLLARMPTAIAEILDAPLEGIEAAEAMLATVASLDFRGPLDPDATSFQSALVRLEASVQSPEQAETLKHLKREWSATFTGNMEAKRRLVGSLSAYITQQRIAMERNSREAQRRGMAGAWAAVFVGLVGLGVCVAVWQRLSRQILMPLEELQRTLGAAQRGDLYRRCTTTAASGELQQVLVSVNRLLDEQAEGDESSPASASGG